MRSRVTLRGLADRQFVSARHVQRLFVEQTGLTFTTWRTQARLNAAAAALRSGRGPAAALTASGFTTRDGLRKALRRESGLTPERLLADVTTDPTGSHAA
ncbi:helix-turn-helix domain-containing protein [Pseudonocardia saturnea]